MRKCTRCKKVKSIESFHKPDGSFYKHCYKCREYQRRWRASDKGKASTIRSSAKYNTSEKGRVANTKWQGKFNASAKGKSSRERYRRSKRGKATARRAKKRNRHHYEARNSVNNSLRHRKIHRPASCIICDQSTKLHAHHYLGWNKKHYLDIWWVCNRCDPSFNSSLPHDGSLTLDQAKELLSAK